MVPWLMESRSKVARREQQNAAKTLPADIVFEILLQLRVKPLLRFCSVSKSWSALISDPSFQRSHHQRSKQNPLLFLTRVHEQTHFTHYAHYSLDRKTGKSLEYLFKGADSEDGPLPRLTIPTCMDLVCMYDRHDIYIVNPATRQQITLPKSSSAYTNCFDQNVAFGYVASTSEYKIFRAIWFTKFYYACEVFTLGASNSWSPVETHDALDLLDDITMVDGFVYVMSQPLTESYYHIFQFDLEKEEWSKLPLPEANELLPYDVVPLFFVKHVAGVLCLTCFFSDKRFEIWLLKDYCKDGKHYSWVKEYSIDTSTLCHPCGIYPLAIEEDGRVVLWLDDFFYYDPKSKSFEEIVGEKVFKGSFYVESFMSLSM